jgi:anti-sigma factor RsiW
MTCRELAEFILDYTTGDLPHEMREVFELHLSRCGNCHEYLEQYKHTVECERRAFGSVEELLPTEVPEELIQAILKARRELLK